MTDAPHISKTAQKITLRVNQVPEGEEMPVRMAARQLARQLGKDVVLFINGRRVPILSDFEKH